MPASTRSKSLSNSDSQSQESSIPLKRPFQPGCQIPHGKRQSIRTPSPRTNPRSIIPETSSQSQGAESHQSGSIATLPPKYTILLAVPHEELPLSKAILQQNYIRGEELLSDAWRRDGASEGKLEDLRKLQTKRVVRVQGNLEAAGQPGKLDLRNVETLWYTAGLRHHCLCQLQPCRSAFIPSLSPPLNPSLPILPSLEDRSHIPHVGTEIPEWNDASPPVGSGLSAIEDMLEEFDHQWMNVIIKPRIRIIAGSPNHTPESPIAPMSTPPFQNSKKGKARADGKIFSRPPPFLPKQVLTTVHNQSEKIKTGDPIQANFVIPHISPAVNTSLGTSGVRETPSNELARDVGRDTEFPADPSHRRKQWWREEIQGDGGYGLMWEVVPRPHKLAAPYISSNPPSAESAQSPNLDYRLPRNYSTLNHPFHPDPYHYARTSPNSLVHWLIPIHGPIIIPHLDDPVDFDLNLPITSTLNPTTMQYRPKPWPSPARLIPSNKISTVPKSHFNEKPKPLIWTSNSLKSFWRTLKDWQSIPNLPFSGLSIVLSGPKPDPYISFKQPREMTEHRSLPPLNASTPNSRIPVRPECGDHIRLYCFAKGAMTLRTWLHNMKLSDIASQTMGIEDDVVVNLLTSDIGDGFDADSVKDLGEQVFKGTRLVLVGPRGEVLTVA